MPRLPTAFLTLAGSFSKANSGVCTPMTTRPRSPYFSAGLYLALAAFWLYAAYHDKYRDAAILTAILFAGGLAAGRKGTTQG